MRKDSKKEEILGFVLLSDEIRPSAKDLLDFFKKNSIRTKIISGDNLPTIEKILVSLSFFPQKSVDLSTISHPNYNSLAVEYDIFARANPEQKKLLIRALKNAGHTVAMTGDGVNDCLALREADCGISISDGTDATRRVSDIVLLNNDFLTIPSIVFEGRRAINNIVRSSALFLNKTIFATVLGIIYIFLNFRYPFSPIEMSLINTVTIGIPSFILALEPNFSQVTNNFKRHILINSLPAALAAIFSTISISIISNLFKFSWTETISLSYLLTSFIGLLLIYKISRPLKKLHKILLSTLAAILILVLLISPFRNFFGLSSISPALLTISLVLGTISIMIFIFSNRFLSHRSI